MLGGFQFNDLHYKSQKLVRTRESLKHFDNEYYTFGFPLSGPLQVQQMGKQHRVGPGCVYLMKQTSAYVATPLNQHGFHSLSVSIPASTFRPKVKTLGDFYQLQLHNSSPQARLLADYLRGLFDGIGHWNENQTALVSNQLVDLICMFMLGSPQTADLEPIHLTRAKNYIQQQLSHPGLTAAQIARAVGISVSYLHKLFADQGETLQTYLFTQRIAQGRAMLEDPQYRALSIGQIAAACGFKQLSHFSRYFKEYIGQSPSSYRSDVNCG